MARLVGPRALAPFFVVGLLVPLISGCQTQEDEGPEVDEPQEDEGPEVDEPQEDEGRDLDEPQEDGPEVDEPQEEVLGAWRWDVDDFHMGDLRIRETDGGFILERDLFDGSSGEVELEEVPHDGPGRQFQQSHEPFGEYYVVLDDGRLQMWDEDGLIEVLSEIDP